MAKTIVKSKDPYRWEAAAWTTKAEWLRWENVGMAPDLFLDDLTLNWVDERVVDLEIAGAIESVQMDRTIEGASTLAITLRDPPSNSRDTSRHLFNFWAGRARARVFDKSKNIPVDEGWQEIQATDIVERAVDISIDGVAFRLVKVNINWGINQYILTFEDRFINRLRKKKGALSESRAQITRAEFVLRLIREIKIEKPPFICPELHQKQAVKKQKTSGVHDDPDGGGGGFSKGQSFRVKGATANAEQKRNMSVVLEEATGIKGAKKKAVKAVIEAVIVESQVKNLVGGDKDSRGILQVRDSTAGPIHLDNRDIRACVRHFMTKGFWGKGGAIQIAKENPKQSAGWVAQQTQGSGVPDAYDKVASEAEHWFKAWSGETGVSGGGGSYVKSFQYKRDKNEDSWTAIQRLAEEVKWRCFPVGRAVYFMSEDDLFRRRVRHIITPESDEFIDFQADVDWGKPVNELTMTVTASRWDAPPGCVVQLDGFAAVRGRWLVVSSSRDWFSPLIELTLRQPGNPDREPAAERVERSESARAGGGGGLSEGKSADFYHYAQLISKNTSHYSHGAHGPPLSTMNSATNHDCSSSVSWAAYKAGMWPKSWGDIAHVSGDFENWGLPGRGEKITVYANGGHVFAIFEKGAGVGKKRFDTGGPGGGTGARVRNAWRPTGGFAVRHWPGT